MALYIQDNFLCTLFMVLENSNFPLDKSSKAIGSMDHLMEKVKLSIHTDKFIMVKFPTSKKMAKDTSTFTTDKNMSANFQRGTLPDMDSFTKMVK